MNILFVHQNYPAQYREILPRLIASGGHRIVFLTQRKEVGAPQGHAVISYRPASMPQGGSHPYTDWFTSSIANAIGAANACRSLAKRGFKPDIVVGHAGWGELIFIKDIWPDVPLIAYFEYYFIAKGGIVGFDPEFPEAPDSPSRLHARSAPAYLTLARCDDGYTASQWQKETFPQIFWPKIKVLHEGIRTDLLEPAHGGGEELVLGNVVLRPGEELVTYVARNFEPGRGVHIMMRTLPKLLKSRPRLRVVMVGADDVSYGLRLPKGQFFRQRLMNELGDKVDWGRVHFVGHLSYGSYKRLLQLSSCHVYLTAPFVVSWSLFEAMALEKTIVASNVPPVRQFLEDGRTAFLIDFFSSDALAEKVIEVLEHPDHYLAMGQAARRHVVDHYDFATVCFPQFVDLINSHVRSDRRVVN